MQQSYAKINNLNKKLDEIRDKINTSILNYNENMSKQNLAKNRLVQFEQDLVNYQNEQLNFSDKDQFEAQLQAYKNEIDQMEKEVHKNTYVIYGNFFRI